MITRFESVSCIGAGYEISRDNFVQIRFILLQSQYSLNDDNDDNDDSTQNHREYLERKHSIVFIKKDTLLLDSDSDI